MFYRIEDRMAKDLKLSCNELLIYGVIYSSQYQTYTRGQEHLSEITWAGLRTVKRILKSFIEKWLLVKVPKWYQIVPNWHFEVPNWHEEESAIFTPDSANMTQKKCQNDTLYINNKITEIEEEIKEEKIVEEVKEKKPVKKKYLDFVLLTEEEYNKLIDRYWKWIIERKIEDLNNYIWSKGKKYKSHYFTILERLRKENIKPLEKKISPAQTKQTNNNDLHLDTRASWLKEAFPMNK